MRDIARAKRIVAAFVMGSWSANWEDIIEKRTKRPEGCLMDALGIDCPDSQRSSLAKMAATRIRARFRRASENRNEWDRKKVKWTEKEYADIIEIVETTTHSALGSFPPPRATEPCSVLTPIDATQNPPDRAVKIVFEFGKLSFNASNWEKMIGQRSLQPHGCLIDALGIECPHSRIEEAKFCGAQALRERYPQYTKSAVAWERKQWTDDDVREIITIVDRTVRACLERPTPSAVPVAQTNKTSDASRNCGNNSGFVPWRLFRDRAPVSGLPGVYLFAYFEEGPPMEVDCSWLDMSPTDESTPRNLEEALLRQYLSRWGRWPKLNKKG
jgi:hypothetical protein